MFDFDEHFPHRMDPVLVSHEQKYKVVDPGFVRFRIKPVMPENMNVQLKKTKKLELICGGSVKAEFLFSEIF